MKVAIYSPYLDTFGGGEKYMLTIAESLSQKHFVNLLFDNHLFSLGADALKEKLGERFNLDLSKVRTITAPVGKGSNPFKRLIFFKNYDILFYLTDGSIFTPSSKKSILHIQSPLAGQPSKSLWGKLKLKSWDLIVYNSKFTQDNSLKNWPIRSKIIYPPIDTHKIKPLNKKKIILSVGRFFGYLEDKKQKILIKTFKDLYKNGQVNNWSLYLAGSAGEGDKDYLDELKKLSKGIPVKLFPNLSYDNLIKLYGKASIYWHASGFGENDPVKMEHFGISTVEAMSGGCVPVVIAKGGQEETVENKRSGFLWNNLDQLKRFSLELISDSNLLNQMSKKAIIRAKKFDKRKFIEEINKII